MSSCACFRLVRTNDSTCPAMEINIEIYSCGVCVCVLHDQIGILFNYIAYPHEDIPFPMFFGLVWVNGLARLGVLSDNLPLCVNSYWDHKDVIHAAFI